jgi:hypothetical protein
MHPVLALNRYFWTLLRIIQTIFLFLSLAILPGFAWSQDPGHVQGRDTIVLHSGLRDTPPPAGRKWIVGGTQAVIWAGTFIGLNKAWYADYPRSDFHFFNDWGEWQQMDKAGHAWTSYHLSRLSGDAWKWAGLGDRKAAIVGGITGVAYMSAIEILDGFSSEWGFSTGDMLMNVTGASLYTVQELTWHRQTFQIKFSYWPNPYPADLKPRAEDLFGNTPMERVLKDYNSQTYWLNVNLHDLFPSSRIPGWFCVSLGYGARVMLGARENKWTEADGTVVDRTDIQRYRRFFLSADVDLTRIHTRNKLLKTVFSIVNLVKIPAPAIEINTSGGFKLHALYY